VTFDYDGLGERAGHRGVGIGEKPYLDPNSKSKSEALAAAAIVATAWSFGTEIELALPFLIGRHEFMKFWSCLVRWGGFIIFARSQMIKIEKYPVINEFCLARTSLFEYNHADEPENNRRKEIFLRVAEQLLKMELRIFRWWNKSLDCLENLDFRFYATM
jgi:hypothetical protein